MTGMEVDVAVVGGGIAGMSVAGELSRDPSLRLAVLEQEGQLAYHASGRSAAVFLESYGSVQIRALTRASRPLFDVTEPDEAPLLTPRPMLWLASAEQVGELEELLAAEAVLRRVDEAEVRALCPVVREGWSKAAAIEDAAQDLDVAALFDRYRRLAVRNGAGIVTGAIVRSGQRGAGGWVLHTDAGEVRATTVVNAAGAWADDLAVRCGLPPVGLTPYRRSVAIVASAQVDRGWPLVCDIGEAFYFRPEGDALLVSPADETPTEPCDASAEIEDIALALDRVNEATTLDLRRVRTTWAGLRTFSKDRNPVVGFDSAHPDFFWLAGQGGYGMQTAPAMALLAASLIRGETVPEGLRAEGFDPQHVAPQRFG